MEKKPGNRFIHFIKFAFAIWFLSIVGAVGTVIYVVGIRKELFDKTPTIFALLLLGFIFIGILAFFAGCVGFVTGNLIRDSKKKQNKLIFLMQLCIIMAIFPLYLLFYVLLRLKPILIKAIALIFVVFVISPVWFGGYIVAGVFVQEQLNIVTEQITVSGTGSMYPTFPKGQGKTVEEQTKEIVGAPGMMRYPAGFELWGKHFFNYEIGRGDIVSFFNDKTKEITEKENGQATGFVKRVVALPGDMIEIRDGIFYLNGEPQKEPYTAVERSTFGGQFLPECMRLTIPASQLFVMGDNRKGSGDSRQELGLINYADINHVIPWAKQKGGLDKNYRDTAEDFAENSKIVLDTGKYIELLNQKRKDAGTKPLRAQTKLNESAKLRGEAILKSNDFSFEATRSGYTMDKAMRDANYSNVTYGEAPTQGYYEAEELIENQFEFPESKKFLLNKDYQEIGIAEVQGTLNACPTQVIVQHFAGYVPPNYNQTDVDSWKSALASLKEIQPGWAGLKNNTKFYEQNKGDVDRINSIISQRIANITAIVSKMESNQWLSSAERSIADQDVALYQEQEAIATRLNSR